MGAENLDRLDFGDTVFSFPNQAGKNHEQILATNLTFMIGNSLENYFNVVYDL